MVALEEDFNKVGWFKYMSLHSALCMCVISKFQL